MKIQLYLLYLPSQGWGVFDNCSCPDLAPFPPYLYKEYGVPEERFDKVIQSLINAKEQLVAQEIIPTVDNWGDIFPDITDVLKEE